MNNINNINDIITINNDILIAKIWYNSLIKKYSKTNKKCYYITSQKLLDKINILIQAKAIYQYSKLNNL
jgi:hypothetical protein